MKCPIEITDAHIVYDRSRATTDWNCPRQRYHNYERSVDGQDVGIVPEDEQLELFTGSVIHDAMAAIASTDPVDIDQIASDAAGRIHGYHTQGTPTDAQQLYAAEQAALIYGIIKGFYQHVWPQTIEKYEIVAVEEEMFFVHDQNGVGTLDGFFVMMCKPDLVVRDRESKELVYIEYKSTSSKQDGWINSWEDSVQVHSTINAIHQSLGERPTQVIIQGLYKGYESYGKQSSPFCYAYRASGNPPFAKEIISYEYRNGLRRVPTWELEGGTKKWVEEMPANVLADQFPKTPPIFPNDELITDFFMQRAIRELEIQMAKQMLPFADEASKKVILNGAFPQRFDRCKAPYGPKRAPCAFRFLCHGNCKDPLAAGFVKREPHHELEITKLQEAHEEAASS